tara:strand:+ start:3451 stop:3762 length:312 start_codon:yes stop_codon:yes gene_type:complete
MATRQTSSSGKQKSPRIQVVLSEELFEKLGNLSELESRTISNMAKVLIQKGIKNYEEENATNLFDSELIDDTEQFRNSLETRKISRLKGLPKTIKFLNSKDFK